MRFKMLPFAYWSVLTLQIIIIFFFAIILSLPVNKNHESWKIALQLYSLLELLLIPATIACCQKVCINKEGIYKCFAFIKWNKLSWDEVIEVGYLYTGTWYAAYKYIYFSKRKLTHQEICKGDIKGMKDILLVQYSDKAIRYISQYSNIIETKLNFIE